MAIWPNTKSNNQTTISICIDVWSIYFFYVSFTLAPYAPWYDIPCDEFYSFFSFHFSIHIPYLPFPHNSFFFFLLLISLKPIWLQIYIPTYQILCTPIYSHYVPAVCTDQHLSCYYCCIATFERKITRANITKLKWSGRCPSTFRNNGNSTIEAATKIHEKKLKLKKKIFRSKRQR